MTTLTARQYQSGFGNEFATEALPGFKEIQPQVFAGLYPTEASEYDQLRDALEKLKLNDSSLRYEPEVSQALGFGFRCGFLGLLHMEIVQERLEREFNLQLIASAPSCKYQVHLSNGKGELLINNPAQLPSPNHIDEIREPWVNASIVTPSSYIGTIMDLSKNLGITFVIVSHELASIYAIADKVIMLDKGAKGIIAEGDPKVLRDTSTDPRVHQFFNRIMSKDVA